ncbi:MAG: DMT family transporter [Alphaproteobacteria bacterium]|jgi:drug/metabolite transporter (DMT)-like permease
MAAAAAQLSPSLRGALWMLGSAVCFGMHGPIVRVLSFQLDPMVISFARSIFMLVIIAPFLVRNGRASLHTSRPVMIALRGLVSACGLMLMIYAQAHMPLARVTALTFTAPLFAVLGAAFILRESVGFSRWAATLVGFAGTLVILRPDSGDIELLALAPLGAALFIAMSNLMAKTLAADHGASTLVAWVAIWTAIITFFPALSVWSWPDLAGFGWLLALGCVTAGAHQCLIRALAAADASAVMPYDYTRLLFTAAIGWYAFGEVPAISMWAGAAIIVAATIYNARRESRG